MAEDPQERRLAVRTRLETEAELEQAASELTPELRVADADAIALQQPADRAPEGTTLAHR